MTKNSSPTRITFTFLWSEEKNSFSRLFAEKFKLTILTSGFVHVPCWHPVLKIRFFYLHIQFTTKRILEVASHLATLGTPCMLVQTIPSGNGIHWAFHNILVSGGSRLGIWLKYILCSIFMSHTKSS